MLQQKIMIVLYVVMWQQISPQNKNMFEAKLNNQVKISPSKNFNSEHLLHYQFL